MCLVPFVVFNIHNSALKFDENQGAGVSSGLSDPHPAELVDLLGDVFCLGREHGLAWRRSVLKAYPPHMWVFLFLLDILWLPLAEAHSVHTRAVSLIPPVLPRGDISRNLLRSESDFPQLLHYWSLESCFYPSWLVPCSVSPVSSSLVHRPSGNKRNNSDMKVLSRNPVVQTPNG